MKIRIQAPHLTRASLTAPRGICSKRIAYKQKQQQQQQQQQQEQQQDITLIKGVSLWCVCLLYSVCV